MIHKERITISRWKMGSFVENENLNRVDEYKKDNEIEDFIRAFNAKLHDTEVYNKDLPELPNIFIFGLPRSGTTLTYQLIANSLELGYVNNLMARFWLAPISGIRLSRSVLGDMRDDSFMSDYGKSTEITGPHEFAYFWHHWLKINDTDDMLDFSGYKASVDWKSLRNIILNMQQAFSGKGMVFKTNYVVNFLEQFAETFENAIFIYIKRDPLDVACSILKARKKYFGDYNQWWATHPENFEQLKALPYHEQVVEQVLSLERLYDHKAKQINSEKSIMITYDELCKNPKKFIEDIRAKVRHLSGYDLDIVNEIPETFTFRKKIHLSDEEKVLDQLLLKRRN